MEIEKANKLFLEMLEFMEFQLVKDEEGYGLIDLQGGNLGDIQSERFSSGTAILDRLDRYIDDYYANAIEEGINKLDDKERLLTANDVYDNIIALLKMRKNPESISEEYLNFIKQVESDLDIMDLVINNYDKIVLEDLSYSIVSVGG